MAAAVPDGAIKGRVAEGLIKGEGEEIDVAEAEVIVSGGRGMKGPGEFRPAEGASRP